MKFFLPILAALALVSMRAEDKPAKPDSSAATASAKKYENIDADTFGKMRKSEMRIV